MPETHPTDGGIHHVVPALHGQLMRIADLRLDPKNVRDHDARSIKAIREAYQRFGQQKPIVVAADGTVIAGNGQLTAARDLGWTHIAAVETNLGPDDARAFAIADNRTSDLSEFDPAKLTAALREFDPATALDVGFDESELLATLGSQPIVPGGTATFDDVDGSGNEEDEDAEAMFRDMSAPASPVPSGVAPDPSSGYATVILTADTETIASVRAGLNRIKRDNDLTTLTEAVAWLLNQQETDDE